MTELAPVEHGPTTAGRQRLPGDQQMHPTGRPVLKHRRYTEPDPRDDLAGMDVARKVTILARHAALQGLGFRAQGRRAHSPARHAPPHVLLVCLPALPCNHAMHSLPDSASGKAQVDI
jgi:Homoserine dehydrogenase